MQDRMASCPPALTVIFDDFCFSNIPHTHLLQLNYVIAVKSGFHNVLVHGSV